MRNSPAPGWPGRQGPPGALPPPPPRGAGGRQTDPHRLPPQDPLAVEGGRHLGEHLGNALNPSDLAYWNAVGGLDLGTSPESNLIPGSGALGSAQSYASSYLLDANLGLDSGPQTALDCTRAAPLSAAAGEDVQPIPSSCPRTCFCFYKTGNSVARFRTILEAGVSMCIRPRAKTCDCHVKDALKASRTLEQPVAGHDAQL